MESLVRGVEKGCSGFATRTTKRTTVLDAKLVEKFLRTADCPGYCDRTGRGRSKNSKPSSAARWSFASGGLAQFGLPGGFQQVSRHSQLLAARASPRCPADLSIDRLPLWVQQ